ncbi:hypothetical protein SAY87_003493 [Trapa incisa]|uniref:Uncharacterized protein n=1 Tax=Trapa incisa TaxID=236973 RepID=A0AAN7KSN2_9MYRT|nr:hypothetical protein SAY87_003493 [Trapa incisa]
MGEDSRAGQGTDNYYGTFQGVANYWPPLPRPPLTAFPQPAPPPGTTFAVHPNTAFYSNGYQTSITTGYAMVDGTPLTVGPTAGHGRLPCCGLGMGWVLELIPGGA